MEGVRYRFLKYGIGLSNFLRILRLKRKLFAAENDALKQEDVVFAVDLGFGYNENVFQ